MSFQTLNDQQIELVIANEKKPVVIDIWMDDCPPCNMLAPKLKAVAKDYQDQIKVFKVNVANDSPVFDDFGIEMVPTLLFFKGGEQISRLEGMVNSNELDQQFKQLIDL